MRKLLISVLIFLLLLVTIYSVVKGLSIGNIKILGFKNIQIESEKLDKEIEDITRLKEQEYKKVLSDIEANAKTLLQEKEAYATLVTTSTESEIEKATHAQKYDQDFLWAKIGNHATAGGITLKFEIKAGALNKDNYDLYFTISGNYTNITEFVRALENDNLLNFKIENFKLLPAGSSTTSTTKNTNTSTNTTTNTNANTNANTTNTNNNTDNNTNTNENSNTTESQSSGGDSGTLQATFKVTDIGINIDKTKITSSSSSQATTEAEVVEPTTEGEVTE